ncbi:MAG: uroporphyrinogen-III C-methyltransferase [Verrucomicrobiota bacterium]|nr:uroporphyrinogen-III C-methyltransferase [Verrucomicrobiales bacterium]MEC9036079.1 uroporphyrinogen-III C-methyltransferase [Verrucomicrobiota bacterium]MEE2966731.1 uroporphyrinogen-III C-methyltransferase [Verrucomicrobiota bacterium]
MSDSDTTKKGICYLVGAGPGDPGLLTLRAKQCLEMADVVVYDYLCNIDILNHAPVTSERIYAGKKAADHAIPQDELNDLLVKLSLEGKTVVRLKGGDPFVFGRGGEEAQELYESGVPFEIVPGISSSVAGPAYAGIPVTHRDHCSQLTIFTGHEDPTKEDSALDYSKIGSSEGTKVMLMGVGQLAKVTQMMIDGGASPDTPVALIRWATTGNQKTLVGKLDDIADRSEDVGFKAPAVAVFGEVVKLRQTLNWFEGRPLFGKKIVVTRTRSQAGELSARLRCLGADVDEMPTIRIEPPENIKEFAELVQDSHKYSWIIFTSPNGVDSFFDMFFKLYKDARSIGGAKIAVIGPGTQKKVQDYHLSVDLIPDEYVAEGLVKKMLEVGSVENETILLVRPSTARDVISEGLTEAGAIVDEAIAYQTVCESEDPTGAVQRFQAGDTDLITFTSSSTVESFIDMDLPIPDHLIIASIGPITSKTLQSAGLRVDIEAKESNIPGLVSAIEDYFIELEED